MSVQAKSVAKTKRKKNLQHQYQIFKNKKRKYSDMKKSGKMRLGQCKVAQEMTAASSLP